MIRPRLSARLRLTAIFLGLFLVAGSAVVGVNYALLSSHLRNSSVNVSFSAGDGFVRPPQTGRPAQMPNNTVASIGRLDPNVERAVLSDRSNALAALLRISVLTMLVALAVAGLLVWFVARRMLRPLADMRAAATRITENSLDERLPLHGPRDELHDLATTFNEMMDRLGGAFAHERRLVANASHELGTPIANQQTLLEVVLADPEADAEDLRRACEIARVESLRAGRLLRGMLALSQAEHAELSQSQVRLDKLLDAAIAERDDSSVTISYEPQPVLVTADVFLLERLISNVLSNAITHNNEEAWVRVEVRDELGAVTLAITNSCEPVGTDVVDNLIEPFRRGTPDRTGSRSGSGLGLSIVKAITEAHGWVMTLDSSGHTFLLEIRIPA